MLELKQTFKEFAESEEGIATNILSARLKDLEDFQLITKSKLPDNKKTNIYRLTDKGIGLAAIIVDLALWSDAYLRDVHPNMDSEPPLELMRNDQAAAVRMLQEDYLSKIGMQDS